jgi:ABC-type antimicrobial peptide transport system permease subunit
VYGVIAYRMAKRSRELAVRVAIGAAPGQVLSMTLREGLRVLVIGLAVGVPCALAVTRQMTSLLFGVRPWDTPAFVVSCILLLAVVGAAVLIPSIRATRVNPATLLRG